MKTLFFDCRSYAAERKDINEIMKDCVAVFVTVEEGDKENEIIRLVKDIKKIKKKYGRTRLMIGPFAHLSNSLAKPDIAIKLLNRAKEMCESDFEEILVSGFDIEKGLTLDVYKGEHNILFRSY